MFSAENKSEIIGAGATRHLQILALHKSERISAQVKKQYLLL
jgi:hypothetical protein